MCPRKQPEMSRRAGSEAGKLGSSDHCSSRSRSPVPSQQGRQSPDIYCSQLTHGPTCALWRCLWQNTVGTHDAHPCSPHRPPSRPGLVDPTQSVTPEYCFGPCSLPSTCSWPVSGRSWVCSLLSLHSDSDSEQGPGEWSLLTIACIKHLLSLL